MDQSYDPDEMERLDILHADEFARSKGWQEHAYLQDPLKDLALFFSHFSGQDLLDAGCGWGRYVEQFLSRNLKYTGLDHSAEMLKAAQEANPETSFVLGSVRQIPLPDYHFDGIWSCCVLSAIPKRNLVEVLREHYRVLRPGGVLYVVLPLNHPISYEVLYDDDDGTPIIYQAYYSTDEFGVYLTEAGFTVVEEGYRYDHGSMYIMAKKL
jgi:ubiquinone/menaquinone biosynthesis C-methylase UbiE